MKPNYYVVENGLWLVGQVEEIFGIPTVLCQPREDVLRSIDTGTETNPDGWYSDHRELSGEVTLRNIIFDATIHRDLSGEELWSYMRRVNDMSQEELENELKLIETNV